MTDSIVLVYCTCPDEATAKRLARLVVEEKLAACVNVITQLTSVYEWEGDIQEDSEVLLLAKTREGAYPALEMLLLESHPYELPEIIAVPVTSGLPGYIDWVVRSTKE
ncbi:MAG: divalent-cation tolerance protein CutA [Gammaproteobacteria bacterium]